MAYHPQVGFGIQELTFAELRELSDRMNPLVISLDPGDSIAGRVIDEYGNPVTEARITAFMRSHSLINLSGLYAVSNESGEFLLRGITLENRPHQILASVLAGEPQRPGQRPPRRTIDKHVRDECYNQQRGVWELGVLVLPSTAEVRRKPVSEEMEELESDIGEEEPVVR